MNERCACLDPVAFGRCPLHGDGKRWKVITS